GSSSVDVASPATLDLFSPLRQTRVSLSSENRNAITRDSAVQHLSRSSASASLSQPCAINPAITSASRSSISQQAKPSRSRRRRVRWRDALLISAPSDYRAGSPP